MNFSVTGPVEAANTFIRQLSKPARILVAISGGSDSLGLLKSLINAVACAPDMDVTLFAVTIDHQLRIESAHEAQQVGEICQGFGVPHFIRGWGEAKPKTGISQAARLARYRLIAEVADEVEATAIVTGHTLDDQLETVTMRAARSVRTENAGLSGMAECTLYAGRYWLFRPFLSVRRNDIRDFLKKESLRWIDDPSNDDRKYERVRTRQSLAQQADHSLDVTAGEKRKALSAAAANLLQQFGHGEGRGLIWLEADTLNEKPDVLRHALSAVSAVIGGRQYLAAADSIDRLIAFITESRLGRMTVSRTVFERRRDGLYIYRENRNLPSVLIQPNETCVWDERFLISNSSSEPVTVLANGEKNAEQAVRIFSSVPAGVAKRAFSTMPDVLTAESKAILLRPVLTPYELFLPYFDLELARQIAILLDCVPAPQPPV